ncbi:MAG: hypothetical protein NWS86_02520 [Flavobacteriales bacterium]|nr:hypothetical protein [Flavobacteriales bacterium]
MRIWPFIIALILSSSFQAQEFRNLTLRWEMQEVGAKQTIPTMLPGSVIHTLVEAGALQDPSQENYENQAQWVSEKDWLFTSQKFNLGKFFDYEHIELEFQSLDTYAEIYINGKMVISADNYHRTWRIKDAKKHMDPFVNVIEIKFFSPIKKAEERLKVLEHSLPTEAVRSVNRSPQFQYGWDWAPKLVDMGLHSPIKLIGWNNARILNTNFETSSCNEREAKINAQIKIEADDATHAFGLIHVFNDRDELVFTKDIDQHIDEGINTIDFDFTIENPQLWWSWDLGKPHQYKAIFKAKIDGEPNTILNGETYFGVRKIELIQENDQWGESFYFKLNGKAVYARGANLVPLNIQEHKTDSAQIGALVRDAYRANMNMLRVWGGGIYQDDYFYEQCDKLGMLVWQDFMFACAMYPGNENFLNSVKAESEDQLERLKQHPSIALWCGNNEVSEGWDRWGWKTGLDKKELKLLDEAYNTLFLSLLPEQVKKHTSVPYHASSPSFGRGDERYLKEGDAHDWWVWHDAYPFEHFQENIPRFMSEFGFQSIPQESTLRQAIAGDLDTNNVSLLAHQKHHKGFPTISTYLHRDFNKSNSFESYAYLSRVQQARGIGMGIRAQRLAPQCMGSLYWQLNDCWPAVSWSSIDSEGQWKALHYEARRAHAPFAFDLKSDDNTIHYGISSLEKYAYYGVLRLELFDEFGEKLLQQEETAELEYLDGAIFATDKLKNQACYATLSFIVNDELIASENFPLIEMKQLQVIDGSSNLKPIQEGDKFRFDLKSAFFTYGLEITANVNGTWSDNFLCLAPGEALSIYFTPDTKTKEIQFQAMSLQKTILK